MKYSNEQAIKFVADNPELEEKYGSIFVIAAITTIIFNSIRIYRICKEKRNNKRQMYSGLFDFKLRDRLAFKIQIRKQFPKASRQEVSDIAEALLNQATELEYSEFEKILKETV